MNEDQHFVPEVYLKNFTNSNNKIYGSIYIDRNKSWSLPKPYDTRQICYGTNFYSLDEYQQKKYDTIARYLELTAFKYENKFISELLMLIKLDCVSNAHISEIADFYASMKYRGLNFRNSFSNELWKRQIERKENEIKDLIKMGFELFNLKNKNIDIYHRDLEENIKNNFNQKQFHTDAIYTTLNDSNDIINTAINQIKGYDVVTIKTESNEDLFLTNDCPGFSINNKNQVFDTRFSNDRFHFMPLSPNIGFLLVKAKFSFHKNKRVSSLRADNGMVRLLNWGTIINRSKYVYSCNREHLKEALNYRYE